MTSRMGTLVVITCLHNLKHLFSAISGSETRVATIKDCEHVALLGVLSDKVVEICDHCIGDWLESPVEREDCSSPFFFDPWPV